MPVKDAAKAVKPQVGPIRRVVTGHDAEGRSIVLSDEACPHVQCILGIPTLASTELWSTREMPADNERPGDGASLPLVVAPPAHGTAFRIVEFPPDRDWKESLDSRARLANATEARPSADPMMHRTKSLDYVVVISGEIWSVLDKGEVLMRAGDVMVQRGTNHAWSNRSDKACIVAFVLVDARPINGLDAH